MGTSKPNDGPSDRTPLLPDWAQNPDDGPPAPVPPAPVPPEPLPDDPREPREPDNPPPDLAPRPERPDPVPLPPAGRAWQNAKSDISRYGKSGSRNDLARAGRSYVRARGGAAAATRASSAGRSSAARTIGFISTISSGGLAAALDSIGLRDVLGRSVESVLSAIVNKLAPTGKGKDESAARKAVDTTLVSLFEQYGVLDGGLEQLDALDAAAIERAFHDLVAEYNFQRWMMELSKRIEDNAVSSAEAYRLEQFARECIYEVTVLDFHGHNVLDTDWTAPENQQLIDGIYEQAYVFLENL